MASNSRHAALTTHCRTTSDSYPAYDNAGIKLMSFTVSTYFCYNDTLAGENGWVTYHNTKFSVNVTRPGSAAGWSFVGLVSNNFQCFVADPSHHSCSGNVGTLQAHFQSCILKIGCAASWYPTTEKDEFFNGYAEWFNS